ncbi:Mediator of RNA polymerase II transcription subunit 13-like [Desmophyllum pertusum]|uniref:Mediator of RNA polymerase II transcription subunit 13 n=1 Tax=Desmophyllum pertusum TaxID=174260 RepID=A0A9W9ZV01_9CNID|nr:Mediator of RNA polymerase II transcription subunit 13-like [Desmophyllum pertusum]
MSRITRFFRDGILRIGQKSLKLAKEPVDDWFTLSRQSLNSTPKSFKHHLGPVSRFSESRTDTCWIVRRETNQMIKGIIQVLGTDGERPSGNRRLWSTVDKLSVLLFQWLGLQIQSILPSPFGEEGKVVPIQQILQVDTLTGSRDAAVTFVTQLKCLAFSVFSRCRKSLPLNLNAKSLTVFGPAARHEALLRQRELTIKFIIVHYFIVTAGKMLKSTQHHMSSATQYLWPLADSADETATSLMASIADASVLYCGYCLSHDDNYLLAVCTDSVGELIESCVISVEPCLRPDGRQRKTAARTKALIKLWEFCQGVIGNITDSLETDWKEILSKTSVLSGDQMFKDTCKTCFSMKQKNRPTILGTSLTSLETEPSIRLYMARGNAMENTNQLAKYHYGLLPKVSSLFEGVSNTRTSVGAVPKPDVSRTYIAVMPVASLKCSIGKRSNTKSHAPPDTTTETVVTDTDILLAGVDDYENDQDPLRHLFPLLKHISISSVTNHVAITFGFFTYAGNIFTSDTTNKVVSISRRICVILQFTKFRGSHHFSHYILLLPRLRQIPQLWNFMMKTGKTDFLFRKLRGTLFRLCTLGRCREHFGPVLLILKQAILLF